MQLSSSLILNIIGFPEKINATTITLVSVFLYIEIAWQTPFKQFTSSLLIFLQKRLIISELAKFRDSPSLFGKYNGYFSPTEKVIFSSVEKIVKFFNCPYSISEFPVCFLLVNNFLSMKSFHYPIFLKYLTVTSS